MTVLLDERVPRTLDQLLPRLQDDALRGALVEAWLFEGAPRRRAAEERLAAAGVRARLRSAYKPLVHFFLEDVASAGLRRARIQYPVCEPAVSGRFLNEAYPLTALLPEVDLRFMPGGPALVYHVDLEYQDGTTEAHGVFVPSDVRVDHLGERRLSPTGWLRITGSQDGSRDTDRRLDTEFEAIFRKIMGAIQAHPWGASEPQFDQLVMLAEIPDAERRLPYYEECISTGEAMHEDLYFSVLEMFKHRAGRGVNDRKTRPGQIVPDVHYTDGDGRARVALEPFAVAEAAQTDIPLETADRPPTLEQVHAELPAFGGRPFAATSRQGRSVPGVYRAGTRPAIVVTAGQHANETSGVVGALRAARRLAERPDAHFAVIPVENPDGYALHRRLCAVHPRHIHHAARYTGFGDELAARTEAPWHEKAARLEAFRLSGATLHVNLHGYPAHEWTRPLTGYVPRGFDDFGIPKGCYLIVRHHPDWAERAAEFRTRVTERLAQIPELVAFNRAQLASYRAHAGDPPFPVYHDILCQTVEDASGATPLVLVTEFPDETIYGDLFALAHTVQMETVLAAEEVHAALDRPGG